MTHVIKWAYKESLKGRHPAQKVGAVLYSGGRVIARRSNMARPHGLCNRGFHAEERLLKCCDEKVVRGSTVVIVRTNTKGFLSAMSRPCDVCYSLLKKAGVRKIVYIDWDRNVSTERV